MSKAAEAVSGHGRWWREARQFILRENPWCVFCVRSGRRTPATVVDHIIPHRGDLKLYGDIENLQGLCKSCHASVKQTLERSGSLRGCDVDGTPLDPEHPWSRAVGFTFEKEISRDIEEANGDRSG